jgi:hypothetical protein
MVRLVSSEVFGGVDGSVDVLRLHARKIEEEDH